MCITLIVNMLLSGTQIVYQICLALMKSCFLRVTVADREQTECVAEMLMQCLSPFSISLKKQDDPMETHLGNNVEAEPPFEK